jgi:tRNA pseudouridine55 synthase
MDGVLVIDKPEGLTSHDVVQRVRRWAGQRRVGHLGTLDPGATGVLPVALGEATKLSRLLTLGRKAYRGVIRLGIETDSYDREGKVVAEYEGTWPEGEAVQRALERFRGEIEQVPPPFSAVKRGGEAAYRLARKGVRVELEPRKVTLYEIELLDYRPPEIELRVECSAGTYLRSIAQDLGRLLGTGAHLASLCRTASGPFALEQAIPLERLEELGSERLIPMARATGLPGLSVDAGTARRVGRGIRLMRSDLKGAPREGLIQLVRDGRLVALVEAVPGLPDLRTVRVFLEGTRS